MPHRRRASQRTAEVRRKHELMKSDCTASQMWTEVKNKSKAVISNGNSSKMVDPDLTRQLLHSVQQRNVRSLPPCPLPQYLHQITVPDEFQNKGSTAAATRPSRTEESITNSSGIIPGAIAATVFIAFLLALYAVLWKCMVSPPQRKHSKVRVRVKQRTSV